MHLAEAPVRREWDDRNLVFLVSLPRSGSTLLQRVLASHPQITTASETWLLLPFFYALKRRGVFSEYGHATAITALTDFLAGLPGGECDYWRSVRGHVLELFRLAAPGGERYFLEKTPRNNLVLDRLVEVFPRSRLIFLWRNPLSVVASIISTFCADRWKVERFDVDLYSGLANMVRTFESTPNALAVRYEDLVGNPVDETSRIVRHLGLTPDARMVEDFNAVPLRGRMGDPIRRRDGTGIHARSEDKWRTVLDRPIRRRWAKRYLEWIGPDRLRVMGYDLHLLLAELERTPGRHWSIGSDIFWTTYCRMDSLFELQQFRTKLAWHRAGSRISRHD